MEFNKKGLCLKATLAFAGAYIFSFIIYYFGNHLFTETDVFLYIDIFFNKAVYLLLPVLAGVIALIFFAYGKLSSALLVMIPLISVRITYFLPYFYLSFILDGLDTADSILFGILFAVGDAVLAYILSVLIFFAMKIIIEKKSGKDASVAHELSKKTVLDFSDPVCLSFMSVAFLCFLYFFISEIANTVSFIITYSFNFTVSEIIYTVICYIYTLILLFIHYYAQVIIKNKIIEKRLTV